jgi:hypothetical protein
MSTVYDALKIRPRVFVSYHHGLDQWYYDELSRKMSETYSLVTDNSLDRSIDSDNVEYVMRLIREQFLTGTSCTIVLCGLETPNRKYVDWEILATLQKEHALVGLKLPSLPIINDGCAKPARLQDNIDSGYAVWGHYENAISNPAHLAALVHTARENSKRLIDNSRARKLRNG